MKEIVMRRYKRVKKEKLQPPDLILIDGGKGQLNAAVQGLREIDFEGQCEIAGIAKRLEEIFVPGKSAPYMIPKKSSALKLLQRARDEAHRFAINYHRNKRSKRTVKTELTEIDGIGKKTATDLIKIFGSVKQVKASGVEQLQEAIGEKKGESVYNYFNKKADSVA
jgi:excinuclease ABC subunit C